MLDTLKNPNLALDADAQRAPHYAHICYQAPVSFNVERLLSGKLKDRT
jgi:hypothetical protein